MHRFSRWRCTRGNTRPLQRLHVAIVGCGTGGQACAALLARDGHDVAVFEQAPRLASVGAGLLLQPNGQRVLGLLGLLGRIQALGSPVHRIQGHSLQGSIVMRVDYRDLGPEVRGIGIHRGALFESLQSAVEQSGAKVSVGQRIERTVETRHGVRLIGASDAGQAFDLVIVADGARSRLRQSLGLVVHERVYPFAALWFVARDGDARFSGTLRQVYDGTTRMLGVLPTGTTREGQTPTASVFWSLDAATLSRIRHAGLEAWRSEATAMAPFAAELLAQVRSFDDLIFAPYFDVRCSPMFRGRVVVIGDAAHAMSPQLGLGANLALVDAWTLATCLREADSIDTALARYQRARRGPTDYYSLASRMLTPIFQSHAESIAPLRDATWHAMLQIPWIRRQALLSLVGAKTGLLSHLPPGQLRA